MTGGVAPHGEQSRANARLRGWAGHVNEPNVASFATTVHDVRPTHAAWTIEKDDTAEQDALVTKRHDDEETIIGRPNEAKLTDTMDIPIGHVAVPG